LGKLFYGGYANDSNAASSAPNAITCACCTQGGAHQMESATECDWSDPYVIRGGTQRVVRQAIGDGCAAMSGACTFTTSRG